MSILENAERDLTIIASDPILLAEFKARNPALVKILAARQMPVLRNCPKYQDIVACELTIFDNHLTKKRTDPTARLRGTRFGADIRIWTGTTINWGKPNWKASFKFLWSPKEIETKRNAAKPIKLSDATWSILEHAGKCGMNVGMIPLKIEGTSFDENYFVMVSFEYEDGKVKPTGALLLNDNAGTAFRFKRSSFSNLDGKQRPLRGNAIFKSRYSTHPNHKKWATGEMCDECQSHENGSSE